MIRVLNPLQFSLLDQGLVVRLAKLDPWIRTCWGEILSSLRSKYRFEHKGGNLLWVTPLASAETILDLLLESRIQRPYKSHVMVVPLLMTFSWRNQMGEEAELLFNIPMGFPIGDYYNMNLL